MRFVFILLGIFFVPGIFAQDQPLSQKIYFFSNRPLFSVPSPQSPWFQGFSYFPGIPGGYKARGFHTGWAEVLSPSLRRQKGRLGVPQGRHGPIDDDAFQLSHHHELLHGPSGTRVVTDELWGQSILFFVHGFNMSFEESMERAAQFKMDLKWEGAVVVVDWPTAGVASGYKLDRSVAESDQEAHRSMGDFLAFLTQENVAEGRFAEARGARHVLCHSMGSEIFNRTMIQLSRKSGLRARMFDNIIYAAPDVPVDDFGTAMRHLQGHGTASRYTLYFSKKDAAIKAAKFANILGFEGFGANGRLREFLRGRAGVVPRSYPGVDLIDVDLVNVPNFGNVFLEFRHLYFASSDRVLSDIELLVNRNLPPHARVSTLRPMVSRDGNVSRYFVVP